MARLFRDAALAELGIVVAEVTTATPVDKQSEAAIRQRLALQTAFEDRGDALVRGSAEDERTGASGFQARGAVLLFQP